MVLLPGAEMIIQGMEPGTGRVINVSIEGDSIESVKTIEIGSSHDFGGPGFYLCDGFFDPQVNGFAGVDFNGKDFTPERFHRAAYALAASGVTRFLPTLISASHERLMHQLGIIAEAIENDSLIRAMCPGVHLEGPYISPEDGPRGIHPRDSVRLPDWEEVERFQEACHSHLRCITLAPEMEGAIPFIEKAVEEGIVIGLGHTNAPSEILDQAFRAGARLSCHLGNGAHPFLPRHHNPIEKQLSMDGLMASLIVDGIHLPDYVVKNYVRAKGVERVLLATDSMAGAGASAGTYTLGDLEVEVSPADRSARRVAASRLAGSTLTMDQAVTNVIQFAGVGLASAIQMAGKNGGRLFPEVRKEIIVGGPADFVLFEYGKKLVITSTWIGGEKMY